MARANQLQDKILILGGIKIGDNTELAKKQLSIVELQFSNNSSPPLLKVSKND